MQSQVHDFLQSHGLILSATDLRQMAVRMRLAMQQGLQQDGLNLAMIPAFVAPASPGLTGEVVAVDAGGTNVRAARVRVHPDGQAQVVAIHKAPLPGSDAQPVSRKVFFDKLADLVLALGGCTPRLGFCFSYPARILPSGDGVLLRWTKEVQAPEVVGTEVGAGLAEALHARGLGRPRPVVLNDTVAAAAAGTLVGRGGVATVGLVVGTGTNMAYFERSADIPKCHMYAMPPVQAVNMESGNFDGAPRTIFDEAIDGLSSDPGRQWFEKMVSGRYLGAIIAQVIQEAIRAGLLSSDHDTDVHASNAIRTEHVAAYLTGKLDHAGTLAAFGAANPALGSILLAVCDRAADLVAAGLCAVLMPFREGGRLPTVVAEGTVFWHLPGFAARVERQLQELLGAAQPVTFLHLEQANLIGAAAAALALD